MTILLTVVTLNSVVGLECLHQSDASARFIWSFSPFFVQHFTRAISRQGLHAKNLKTRRSVCLMKRQASMISL